MKQEVKIGQTDYTVPVLIRDTAGAPKTGLTNASAGMDVCYTRVETDNDVVLTDGALVALATPALTDVHLDWGFLEVDATKAPGLYRLDLADGVFATGAWSAVVSLIGTGLDPTHLEFVLVPDAPYTGVNVSQISGDATAADNLEAACDGNTYNVGGGAVVAASVTGAVGSVTGAVGSVTGAVGSVTGNVGGSVASVTGAVGSVTGNVGGSVASVVGAVGSVTGNVGGNVAGTVASVVGAVGSVTGNVGGTVASVVGAVGSVTGAVGSVTGNVGGNVAGTVASVVGAVGSVTGNVGGNVAGTVASVVGAVGSVTGAVGSVTGAVGSVTGNVGGNVTGSVGSVAAGGIAAASFAAGAIDAAALAADAGTEIGTAVWATTVRTLTSGVIKKNAAYSNIEFLMVDSTDHVTPKTGLTVAGTRSIDGGAFAAVTGAIAEVSNGIYQFDAAAADTNGTVITYRFTGTAADDCFVTVHTSD